MEGAYAKGKKGEGPHEELKARGERKWEWTDAKETYAGIRDRPSLGNGA